MTRFAATIRTNLCSDKCPEKFLKSFSDFLTDTFKIDARDVILELHCGVTMLRDGSFDKAMNVDIHHNSKCVTKETKKPIAEDIAEFICDNLHIAKNRTLIFPELDLGW